MKPRAPRTCGRCGATGHDVRACTAAAPPASLRAVAERRDEEPGEADADVSAWDPDDVPAPQPRPRLVVGEAVREPAQRAPLQLLLFASGDAGVTVVAHELLVDLDEAAVIVDAWDKPAILAIGRRFVHMPKRVPVGLVLAAARHLRGAA